MATKLSANRAAVIRFLVTSIRQHAEAIGVPFEKLLFPDGVPPNLTLVMFLLALADTAERIYGVLALADVQLAQELSDDAGFRTERDDAEDAMRILLHRAQGAMIAGWDERALEAVGLGGALPRGGDLLAQLGRTAAGRIETAELGPPLIAIDRPALASLLRDGAARVERSLVDVTREEREAEELRAARDQADDEARRVYSGFADAFAGFALALGHVEVADRVRPTARRRAGLPEEQDLLATDPGADPAVTEPTAEPAVDPTAIEPAVTEPTDPSDPTT